MNAEHTARPAARIGAAVVMLGCIALGLVGLALPVLPGWLFLALAALIGGRLFPSLRRKLHARHPALGRRFERADGILDLPLAQQLRLAGLIGARGLLDGVRAVVAISKLPAGRAVRGRR